MSPQQFCAFESAKLILKCFAVLLLGFVKALAVASFEKAVLQKLALLIGW